MGARDQDFANRRSEKRTCPVCGRRNALIKWDEALDYCRWSRDGKCTFDLNTAMKRRDDLLERSGHPRRYGTSPDDVPESAAAEVFVGQVTVQAKLVAEQPNGVPQAEAWESLKAAIADAAARWHTDNPGVLTSDPEVF
ncbi:MULTISPECIES: hypothetical protein [Nocardia]|uniref:hypothetical protein n=1 Tax=Nocardia TaxID=1817 RepID=UPI0024564E29|nr:MULTISPECIES: hypothetical protein [Nocardia]